MRASDIVRRLVARARRGRVRKLNLEGGMQESVGDHSVPGAFIFSMHRSGSTMFRLMLDSSPSLFAPSETFIWPHFVEMAEDANLLAGLEGLGLSNDEAVRYLWRFASSLQSRLASEVGALRWVDKTPQNLPISAALMSHAPPETKAVLLVRDPRAVLVSIVRRGWSLLDEGPVDPVANAVAYVEQMAQHVQLARQAGMFTVRYEDLVAAPEEQLSRVCQLLEVPFDTAMVRYWEKLHVYRVDDPFAVSARGVNPRRVDAWRSDRAARVITTRVERLALEFGYPPR